MVTKNFNTLNQKQQKLELALRENLKRRKSVVESPQNTGQTAQNTDKTGNKTQ